MPLPGRHLADFLLSGIVSGWLLVDGTSIIWSLLWWCFLVRWLLLREGLGGTGVLVGGGLGTLLGPEGVGILGTCGF